MTITLPKSVEEKIASLPQEEVEAALLRLAEKHGHDKEKALGDALQKGLDASAEGRVIRVSTEEERKALFKDVRDRALERVSQ